MLRRTNGDTDRAGIAQLLAEDILLPSQFADIWGHSTELDPTRRLLFAVLAQAVDDLRLLGLRGETIAWFESESADCITDFRAICDALPGVDADSLLRGLRGCDWSPQRPMGTVNVVERATHRMTVDRYTRKTAHRSGAYFRKRRKMKSIPGDIFVGGESTESLVNAAIADDVA